MPIKVLNSLTKPVQTCQDYKHMYSKKKKKKKKAHTHNHNFTFHKAVFRRQRQELNVDKTLTVCSSRLSPLFTQTHNNNSKS